VPPTTTPLQVLGNMKGVIAVVVSVLLFKNPVTAKGMGGYLITVLGVILYSEVRAGLGARGVQ
jgi:multidrug transporter EmrE-like cation transporter